MKHKKHRQHHKSVQKIKEETTTQNPFLSAGLFEGDIDLGEDKERNENVPKRKNGKRSLSFRWPNGIIPYIFYGEFLDNETAIVKQERVK